MSVCNGCGGVVGVDCWNPPECEWISQQIQQNHIQQQAVNSLDWDAIAWAYSKLVSFGVENSHMDNAMMMDRLKLMLGGYGEQK